MSQSINYTLSALCDNWWILLLVVLVLMLVLIILVVYLKPDEKELRRKAKIQAQINKLEKELNPDLPDWENWLFFILMLVVIIGCAIFTMSQLSNTLGGEVAVNVTMMSGRLG